MKLCLASSPSAKIDIPELLVLCFHFPGEKLPYLSTIPLLPPAPRCILPSGLCLLALQTGLVSMQDLAALGSTSAGRRRQEGGEGLWRKVEREWEGKDLKEENFTLGCSYQGSLSSQHWMYELVALQKIVCSTFRIALSEGGGMLLPEEKLPAQWHPDLERICFVLLLW